MAMLFIGNKQLADGTVVYDPAIPTTFRVTYESNVVKTPVEVPVGVLTNVTYSNADFGIWLKFIALNPNDGIVNVKQGNTGTFKTIRENANPPQASVVVSPGATEMGQTPLTSKTDRRTFFVQTQSMLKPVVPETERLRKFYIGNTFTSGVGVSQGKHLPMQ